MVLPGLIGIFVPYLVVVGFEPFGSSFTMKRRGCKNRRTNDFSRLISAVEKSVCTSIFALEAGKQIGVKLASFQKLLGFYPPKNEQGNRFRGP